MKLNEITKIPQQSGANPFIKKITDQATQFRKAKVEIYPLLAIKIDDVYFFKIQVDGKDAAFIKAIEITDISGEVISINRTWVEPEFRNKGLMTAMYKTLHNQGFVLISDIELSPESISVWKNMKRFSDVKVINRKTKEIRAATDQDFKAEIDAPNESFLLEKIHPWSFHPDNFTMLENEIFVGQQLS